MAEATCRRELELEIPAEEVTKKIESVAKEFARIADVPGFRRGKAPVSLIRRNSRGHQGGSAAIAGAGARGKGGGGAEIDAGFTAAGGQSGFQRGQPLKFRAVFEVLPEFELGNYKGLELEMPAMDITDEDVAKTLKRCASAPRLLRR